MKKVAIIVDAGHLKKGIYHDNYPDINQIVNFCQNLIQITTEDIFRIYYYDCPPFGEKRRLPVSKELYDFSQTEVYSKQQQYLDSISKQALIACRTGELSFQGWKLKSWKNDDGDYAYPNTRNLTDEDFIPDIKQKRVDIKIGLDVALLAIKQIVDRIIIITADTDFIPIMKFARQEGLQVYVGAYSDKFVHQELLIHSDGIRLDPTQGRLPATLNQKTPATANKQQRPPHKKSKAPRPNNPPSR